MSSISSTQAAARGLTDLVRVATAELDAVASANLEAALADLRAARERCSARMHAAAAAVRDTFASVAAECEALTAALAADLDGPAETPAPSLQQPHADCPPVVVEPPAERTEAQRWRDGDFVPEPAADAPAEDPAPEAVAVAANGPAERYPCANAHHGCPATADVPGVTCDGCDRDALFAQPDAPKPARKHRRR